jgi:uncharacterized membrane protein YfcA
MDRCRTTTPRTPAETMPIALGLSEWQHQLLIDIARSRRSAMISQYLGATLGYMRQNRPATVPIMASLLGVSLIGAYAMVLPRGGEAATTLALLIVLLAATLSGIAGFAFSAICGVMLLQVMRDPVQVVEIMMVCSIAIQLLSVAVLWRDIDWRRMSIFLIGGPIGLPVGVALLLHLDPHVCRHVIGALLTAYAAWVLLKPPMTIPRGGPMADIAVGFLGGITGGLAGFPGATVAAWCGLQGWDKRHQRAIYQPYILIMQVLALALIQVMHPTGMHAATVSLADLEFVPPALLGTIFGLTLFARLPDRHFAITVNALLLVSGLGLLL